MKHAVYICIGHRSFNTGLSALVSIDCETEFIEEYIELAKEKFCNQLNINPVEAIVFDAFYVQDISIIE